MLGPFGNDFVLPSQGRSAIPIVTPEDADSTGRSDQEAHAEKSTSDIEELGNGKVQELANFTKAPIVQPATTSLLANSIHAREFVPKGVTARTPSNAGEQEASLAQTAHSRTYTSPGHYNRPYTYLKAEADVYHKQELQHQLYMGQVSKTGTPKHLKQVRSFFIPEKVRTLLTERNEAGQALVPESGLPKKVGNYHSLQSLGNDDERKDYFGYPLHTYKVQHSKDKCIYILVRIEDFILHDESALIVIDNWMHIQHSNIVGIQEAFVTQEFGDSSLVFVYHYHALAKTVHSLFFSEQATDTELIPEEMLWKYAIQISSALKAVHRSSMAARNIDSRKILVTDGQKLRLNYVGILDAIQFDGGVKTARYQQEDLLAFGNLILALACKSLEGVENKEQAILFIESHYSLDLRNFILYLLSKPEPTKTIDGALEKLAPRILEECNRRLMENDRRENILRRELEHGRLARWQIMMGLINERPPFGLASDWSENDGQFLIKLFRDYVFHQVDENGDPVIDMMHVLTCLKKLDAGIDETIMLMHRKQDGCLIVSYKHLKSCILDAMKDLELAGRLK